jgi:hypothetical protein
MSAQAATWRGNQIVESIELSQAQAASAACGEWDDTSVVKLMACPAIAAQIARIPSDKVAEELEEYGIWTLCEVRQASRAENRLKLLWVVCQDLMEP